MVATACSPDGPVAFAVIFTVSPIFTEVEDAETDSFPSAAKTVSVGASTPHRINNVNKKILIFFMLAFIFLPSYSTD